MPNEKLEEVKKLKQSTHLNMAACYLKLGEHRKCIDACTKALSTSPISKAGVFFLFLPFFLISSCSVVHSFFICVLFEHVFELFF